MKAVGPVLGGMAANSAGKYTRKVMRVNAQNAANDGVEQAARIRDAARIQMGRQLVDQGASGFQMGTGSARDALFESAINREFDLATVRRQSGMKSDSFRQEGELAYRQGKSQMIGGMISGAVGLMESVAGAFGGAGGGAGGGG